MVAILFCIILSGIAYVEGYKSTMTKCYGSGVATNLTLVWTNSNKQYTLTPETAGTTFTPPEMASEPKVTWYSQKDKYYHFLMVDPDAPTPQNSTLSDIIHCMLINIKGGTNNINDGTAKEPYMGPAPPSGSDPHHYCQFMFITDDKISYKKPISRQHFNTTAFEQYVNSTRGGGIEGATYFMAQHV
eukprot:26752_1